jgi:peptidoglycan hydrolase CwlO-like protein
VSAQDGDMIHLEHTTHIRTRHRASSRVRRLVAAAAVLVVVTATALMLAAAVAAPPATAAPSLFQLQKEAKRTRAEMATLQEDLQTVGQKVVDAQAKLDAVNQRLNLTRRELRRAEQELDLQRAILAKRAAILYKTGDFDWLDILSSIQSLADIGTLRSLQRAIADQDRRSENEAQRLAREARRLERQVEKEHEEAVVAEREVQQQKIELDQKLAERTAILQDVTKRIKKILASGGLGAALAMSKNGQFTQLSWAKALLVAMRFPVTADNVAAVTAWEMAEGGHWYNTAYYNPLNTTQSMPGATIFNSVGVKAYTSWKQGLEATMITLKNGYYGGILDALKRGNDSEAVARAVGASPWGTGDFSRLL